MEGRSTRRFVLAAGLTLAGAAFARAQTPPRSAPTDSPRLVLDTGLHQHAGRLVSITPAAVVIRDEAGRLVTFPRRDVVAVIPTLGAAASASTPKPRPSPTLRLVDGQILPGSLRPDRPASPDRVRWDSAALGPVSVPLEDVASIVLLPERDNASAPRPSSADTVALLNGDRALGFVAAVGPDVVLEADGVTSTIPRARVVSLGLANSPRPPAGSWVWLPDGTAIAVSAIDVAADGAATFSPRLDTELPAGLAHVESHDLRAVLFDAARLVALSSLSHAVVPSHDRRWTPPIAFGDRAQATLFAADIDLPGPLAVEWTLPPKAERLSMAVEMPPASRVWGDCEVVVTLDDHELARARVNGQAPEAAFNVPLRCDAAARLRVTIEPGASGPIQDRVVLRRAVVLLAATNTDAR